MFYRNINVLISCSTCLELHCIKWRWRWRWTTTNNSYLNIIFICFWHDIKYVKGYTFSYCIFTGCERLERIGGHQPHVCLKKAPMLMPGSCCTRQETKRYLHMTYGSIGKWFTLRMGLHGIMFIQRLYMHRKWHTYRYPIFMSHWMMDLKIWSSQAGAEGNQWQHE